MKRSLFALLFIASNCWSAEFWIYKNQTSRENHYVFSGFMGDYDSLKLTKNGEEMKIEYSTSSALGQRWAGIIAQHPSQNWGNKRGGYDLSAYKTLKFKARGTKGGEFIDKFFIGGTPDGIHDGDSDEAYIERIELTKEWKEYVIDLSDRDMKHIISGFGWAANLDLNDKGISFLIKEIRVEK